MSFLHTALAFIVYVLTPVMQISICLIRYQYLAVK